MYSEISLNQEIISSNFDIEKQTEKEVSISNSKLAGASAHTKKALVDCFNKLTNLYKQMTLDIKHLSLIQEKAEAVSKHLKQIKEACKESEALVAKAIELELPEEDIDRIRASNEEYLSFTKSAEKEFDELKKEISSLLLNIEKLKKEIDFVQKTKDDFTAQLACIEQQFSFA